MKKDVIVIAGPTAVGKTDLSIRVSKAVDGEVINGDAMQVYKGLDIGTAKITKSEMSGVPHHLFDIREPHEPFSAAEYQQEVRGKIEEIQSRGSVPVLTGGTGLYIQSVLFDYQFSDEGKNEEIRSRLELELLEHGRDYLFDKLQQSDPHAASSIHPNNTRRVIRALEAYMTTGITSDARMNRQEIAPLYQHRLIGLTMERDILYKRIDLRVDKMMEQGLEAEVRSLYDQGIRNVQSIQAIGYKEMYDYFDGMVTLDEAVAAIKQNSRRYAKRQMTWFRNKMNMEWFDVTNDREKKIEEIVQSLAGNYT
ncbi:tRNA (adenosine(37)-N6)-dimethylallyltransferase MiaA [Jeotgalibacillus aurantiacus]|uniref:tRNA (adenosine(37)-N6)-dimethylallyltransferase MiaA n=1 Tax=Jeotgalibacillus aurantiacus TaxID=2763266 RepID=UPI001D0AD198|nr:tRNA (adenosine(37)-N6)-dimethylallyltransferase MiaA [Jeotgalibacillus aurantiacus]